MYITWWMTSDDKIEFRECLRIFRLRLRCDTGCVQITQHGIYFGIWILDGVLHHKLLDAGLYCVLDWPALSCTTWRYPTFFCGPSLPPANQVAGRQCFQSVDCVSVFPIRNFHKYTKLVILAVLPTLYFHICSFLLYFEQMMLVNAKLDTSGYNRIIFQSSRLHWSSSCLMGQMKWSWQYWHSCIVESLWKNPISNQRFPEN